MLGKKVLIKADKPKTQTDSGFHIYEQWKSLPQTGEVLAVGPEVEEVKVGDRVLFERYASITLENDERICLESQIFAVEVE